MKHQPAARHSAFYWRDGYQQQIDWTEGKKSAVTRQDLRPSDWHKIWPELATPSKEAA